MKKAKRQIGPANLNYNQILKLKNKTMKLMTSALGSLRSKRKSLSG